MTGLRGVYIFKFKILQLYVCSGNYFFGIGTAIAVDTFPRRDSSSSLRFIYASAIY